MKSRKFGTMQIGCNWMQLGFSKMNGGWDYRLCVCHPSLSQFEASPSCKASTNFRHYPRMFFCFFRKHTWFDLSKKHEFQYVPITNNTGSRHILRSWYRKNMGFSNGILAWLAHVCWSCPWLQSELKASWWYTHPPEKYEFVSWDDCSQYMEKKKCSKPPIRKWFPPLNSRNAGLPAYPSATADVFLFFLQWMVEKLRRYKAN
jgi:hypothetical protein